MIIKLCNYFSKKWQSLIFKILLYFCLSMIVVALILGFNFANRLKPHFKDEVLPNLARYLDYVVADIGAPPDTQIARSLASDLHFDILIEGPDISWSSNQSKRSISSYHLRQAPFPYQKFKVGGERHRFYVLMERNNYKYLFVVKNEFRKGLRHRHWILFSMLAGTLLILYLLIRKLFKPIRLISRQVKKIGDGEFHEPIRVQGTDELSRLADGINAMSEQIQAMLEGKSGMMLAISHELRSPITRMRVNLELLEQNKIQESLINDIKEIDQLIGNIIESERVNQQHSVLNKAKCDLADVIEQVVCSNFSDEPLELAIASVQGNFDAFKIGLLVKNLIDNALRSSIDFKSPVLVTLNCKKSLATIEVIDRGTGISADDLPHITEPFYRPDKARSRQSGGYGIGLYLCKMVVDAHSGNLTIESQEGQGTAVSVTLPIS